MTDSGSQSFRATARGIVVGPLDKRRRRSYHQRQPLGRPANRGKRAFSKARADLSHRGRMVAMGWLRVDYREDAVGVFGIKYLCPPGSDQRLFRRSATLPFATSCCCASSPPATKCRKTGRRRMRPSWFGCRFAPAVSRPLTPRPRTWDFSSCSRRPGTGTGHLAGRRRTPDWWQPLSHAEKAGRGAGPGKAGSPARPSGRGSRAYGRARG